MSAEQMLEKVPHAKTVADVIPVNFDRLPSTALGFEQWRKLVTTIEDLVREHPDLAGAAILHGTATIEETAYALNLTLKTLEPYVQPLIVQARLEQAGRRRA